MAVQKKTDEKLEELKRKQEAAKAAGGRERVDQQHAKGKLTARERIELLVDPGSFEELDAFVAHRTSEFGTDERRYPGDAVVTGYAQINGRPTYLYAHDFTVFGGSLSEVVAEKICKVMDMAMKSGVPVVGLADSGGARIQEGVKSLAGYGDIFLRNTLASGVIPQISAILGPSAGGAVYSPAITDFVLMVKGISQMFVTGPDVVRSVMGEEITHEQLGGAGSHALISGVAQFVLDSEEECMETIRHLLSFLPQNNLDDAPIGDLGDDPDRADEDLRTIVPDDSAKAYDMKQVIERVIDDAEFLEVHREFAPNIIVGFARLMGQSVGIVAQQPAHVAGVIDINASVKAARFVRFCDAFNIPIVTFVDVPGFMPGKEQEHGGIIRHGAKLLYAYAEATVPKLTVITRKAYGGAYVVMGSKHLRSDVNFAWPTAEIAVMGPDAAVNIVYRERLATAEVPEVTRAELAEEYREHFANPYVSAEHGYLDAVIDPAETRSKLIRALGMLQNKRDSLPPKKHGNIPL